MYVDAVVLDEESDLISEKLLKIVTHQEYRERGLEMKLGPLVKEGAYIKRGDLLLTFESDEHSIPINAPVDMEIVEMFNGEHYRETNERLMVKPDILITEENAEELGKLFYNERLEEIVRDYDASRHAVHEEYMAVLDKLRSTHKKGSAVAVRMREVYEEIASIAKYETKCIGTDSQYADIERRQKSVDWIYNKSILILPILIIVSVAYGYFAHDKSAYDFAIGISLLLAAVFVLSALADRKLDKERDKIEPILEHLKDIKVKKEKLNQEADGLEKESAQLEEAAEEMNKEIDKRKEERERKNGSGITA